MSRFTLLDGTPRTLDLPGSREVVDTGMTSESRALTETHAIREMQTPRVFTRQEFFKLGIIHPGMEDQKAVNAFRQLRTSLLAQMTRFNSSVIVSSVKNGGGASFNALNLATAFTFDHNKTALLIDCNFEKPVLADRLEVDYEVGLKDYLSGAVDDVGSIVYPTGVPRLRLVPAGHAGSDMVEFFTGERMHQFLDEVRNRYPDRVIIIDAPPILESADTKILAELCDHVLIVVPYKGVTSGTIKKTLTSIDPTKVAGMVMNN